MQCGAEMGQWGPEFGADTANQGTKTAQALGSISTTGADEDEVEYFL